MPNRKKLIEVALPLQAINDASRREKSIRHGHPSTLHLWWARRPLAAARAVIFAQMVDDPSSLPDLFPTEKAQEKERARLFRIIEDLVKWESTTNKAVLQKARDEIWQSWRRACAENADDPRAHLFDRHRLPSFHDPFAGGGTLPLEAQRLGLESYASDLNPVAVLINKAMIEIPPEVANGAPVNPEWASKSDGEKALTTWTGTQGLAADVRYYGQWVRDQAEKRIGHLYPKVKVTAQLAASRPDLEPLLGQELTVVAWLWARSVKSPNPAFRDLDVPLTSTFYLSTKAGHEAYVEPIIGERSYEFVVRVGKPTSAKLIERGTKDNGSNFRCIMSGSVIDANYIRSEAQSGRMRTRLLAVICEGSGGRIFVSPTQEMESLALSAPEIWKPDLVVPTQCHDVDRLPMYGMPSWGDAFSARQRLALTTFADLIQDARAQIYDDASQTSYISENNSANLASARQYADAVSIFLALAVGRSANYWSSLTPWAGDFIVQTFGRNAIRMVWDYAEANPFSKSTANWLGAIDWIAKVIESSLSAFAAGHSQQAAAQGQNISQDKVVSTDPPYYDNIGYAELSDFFYVWLRRALRSIESELFGTLAVPKVDELVAAVHRHGDKKNAEKFFLNGMTDAIHRIAISSHSAFPVTIYYAFKQAETKKDEGTASTGWETFLDAVIRAGFGITGTWPIRTERDQGLKTGTNVLASSIVLVCRPRSADAATATRREFVAALREELPKALRNLQAGNIAPVDLAQAAIGPGMGVYTRYPKVLDAEGKPVSVREALALINATLDEALAEQEGDFDADSRWALAWFEQSGFAEGEYGVAETLSKAKNTSVAGLANSGILDSKRGKVRLLKPEELPANWDPTTDPRLTSWEVVHHLIRVLGSGGESAAADLVAKLGARAEIARELAYRLYTICERKKRATEALAYNGLVQSWPEIVRLAQEGGRPAPAEPDLFNAGER